MPVPLALLPRPHVPPSRVMAGKGASHGSSPGGWWAQGSQLAGLCPAAAHTKCHWQTISFFKSCCCSLASVPSHKPGQGRPWRHFCFLRSTAHAGRSTSRYTSHKPSTIKSRSTTSQPTATARVLRHGSNACGSSLWTMCTARTFKSRKVQRTRTRENPQMPPKPNLVIVASIQLACPWTLSMQQLSSCISE